MYFGLVIRLSSLFIIIILVVVAAVMEYPTRLPLDSMTAGMFVKGQARVMLVRLQVMQVKKPLTKV